MRIDLYTKIVLTVIAVALVALAVQPYTMPKAADAQEIVDVRIRGIDESPYLFWEAINVHCVNCH